MADLTVEFCGETFRLTDSGVALAPLIAFARVAKRGVDSSDMDGLIALGDLVDVLLIDEDEAARFARVATKHRADGDAYMKVVQDAIGALAARPTQRPSGSSDGSPTASTPSADGSSSPAAPPSDPLAGRPDLMLIRQQASA